MAARIGEKIPGWVERLLIPAMESRVRSIVKDEVAHLEKVVDARFDAMDDKLEARFEAMDDKFEALEDKLEARFETLDTKIDSLDKRFPMLQEMAEIKARLTQIEKNQR